MTHTFHIDSSSEEAKALLEYLRTLAFVREEKNEGFVLTEAHKAILEKRRENHLSGKSKSYTWDEIKSDLKKNNSL